MCGFGHMFSAMNWFSCVQLGFMWPIHRGKKLCVLGKNAASLWEMWYLLKGPMSCLEERMYKRSGVFLSDSVWLRHVSFKCRPRHVCSRICMYVMYFWASDQMSYRSRRHLNDAETFQEMSYAWAMWRLIWMSHLYEICRVAVNVICRISGKVTCCISKKGYIKEVFIFLSDTTFEWCMMIMIDDDNTRNVVFLSDMGWLRWVGSLKLHVSFAEYRLLYRTLLQKRPIILRSLLLEATPYHSRKGHFSRDMSDLLTFQGSFKLYVSFAKEPCKNMFCKNDL